MPGQDPQVEIPTTIGGLADAILLVCAETNGPEPWPEAEPGSPASALHGLAILAHAVQLHQERIAESMKPLPPEVHRLFLAATGLQEHDTPAMHMFASAMMQGRDKMQAGGTPFDLPRAGMMDACDYGVEMVLDDLGDSGHTFRDTERRRSLWNTLYAAGLATGEQLAKARW